MRTFTMRGIMNRMHSKIMWAIVVFLIVVVLGWLLVIVPAPGKGSTATSTSPTEQALHDRVVVDSPASGATVEKTFTVTGQAPGNWYFEASFPVQVRDADNNKVGQGIAQAQSDWTTGDQVAFKAEVTVTGFSGPGTLVLLRDNPSGLPENDDALEIPIVIQ